MIENSFLEYSDVNNSNIEKMYSKLCILPNQPDSIHIRVTLPNNDILLAYFALWDTILDMKYYILPALQPTIKNIQQIKCVMYDGCQQFEASNHILLKHFWNNNLIRVYINIENCYEKTNNTAIQNYMVCPDYGNSTLNTNIIMPKKTMGYRNKKTGKLYKNTMTQTVHKISDYNGCSNENKNSLAVQTFQTSDSTTDCVVEFGTQTEIISDLQLLNAIREIAPRRHNISHEQHSNEESDKNVRIIQNVVRMWMTRKKFERMLKYYNYLKQITCNEKENLKNIINTKQQQNITNLQYPTKARDFEALYSAIHNHYKNIKNNKKSKTPKSIKIENKEHLRNQFECLKQITKYRNQANEIAKEKRIFRQLNEISKPVIMTRSNGEKMYIETLETNKAKQYMELFVSLKRNDLNKIERIELLEKFIKILECFKETDLTKPIIKLLSRELTMLKVIQLNDDQLQILRKRIEIGIQWILKQPEINPAISRISNSTHFITCYKCKQLKSLNRFVIRSSLSEMTTCKDCKHLRRITTNQIDLTPHEDMLKNIKTTETQLCARRSLVYILNKEDIYYLVTIIWKGKSAISECKDIIQLILVRWDNKQDWSPSNTILLTIEEAYHHSKIHNINKYYSSTFINDVRLKHMIAKKYFKNLTKKTMECDRTIKRQKYNYYK